MKIQIWLKSSIELQDFIILNLVVSVLLVEREQDGCLKIIDKIINGKGSMNDINTLESIPSMISGSTICALGDAAAMPVESFIKYFKNEFLNYIKEDNLSNLTNFKINSKTNKKNLYYIKNENKNKQ